MNQNQWLLLTELPLMEEYQVRFNLNSNLLLLTTRVFSFACLDANQDWEHINFDPAKASYVNTESEQTQLSEESRSIESTLAFKTLTKRHSRVNLLSSSRHMHTNKHLQVSLNHPRTTSEPNIAKVSMCTMNCSLYCIGDKDTLYPIEVNTFNMSMIIVLYYVRKLPKYVFDVILSQCTVA